MTDDPRAHLDDEALSAVLDGAGSDDDARHAAGCVSCTARLDVLRAVAAAVAAPVSPLDPARLDVAVAAALSAQNVVPLSVARTARRPPAWLGAAAAVATVLAVGGLLGRASGDRSSDETAAGRATDVAEDSAGGTGAAGGEDMMTMERETTADAPVAGSLAGTDLGELRGADLRAAVEARRAERSAAATPAGTDGDADPAGGVAGPSPPCEAELRAADTGLGLVTFTGHGTWDGEPVTVVVFDAGTERRGFVVAVADACAVRSTASWPA